MRQGVHHLVIPGDGRRGQGAAAGSPFPALVDRDPSRLSESEDSLTGEQPDGWNPENGARMRRSTIRPMFRGPGRGLVLIHAGSHVENSRRRNKNLAIGRRHAHHRDRTAGIRTIFLKCFRFLDKFEESIAGRWGFRRATRVLAEPFGQRRRRRTLLAWLAASPDGIKCGARGIKDVFR